MEKINEIPKISNKVRGISNKMTVSFSLASTLKLVLAIALFVIFALIVIAGDVVVQNGKIDVDSKLFVNDAGNVGIGTTDPGELLEIQKDGGPVALRIHDTGTVEYKLGIAAGETTLRLVNTNSQAAGAFTSNGISITSAGNVGIGTTGPSEKLHVSGGSIRVSDSGGPRYFWDQTGATEDNKKWELAARSERLEGRILTDSEGAATNWLVVERTGTMVDDITFAGGRLVLSTSGNVGIGTTGPNTKLQVGTRTNLWTEGGDRTNLAQNIYEAGAYWKHIETGAGSFMQLTNVGGFDFYTAPSGTAGAAASISNKVSITNAGNVGIGITGPGYPLTISKNGAAWDSFGKVKNVQLMVNGNNQGGGGIAISDDGGFFDWNDGYVTYEPLCCGQGLKVNSNFVVTGSKSAIVNTTNYGQRKLYALESPEVKFIDDGESMLNNGEATIYLEPIFKETIENTNDYLVQLTPVDEVNGLRVAERSKDYFVVKELNNGKGNARFMWMISAHRKSYSSVRLEKA